MSLSLVLNSNNVVNNGLNSQYQYNFINGAFNVPPNSTMCISNVTIPYSWFIPIYFSRFFRTTNVYKYNSKWLLRC